MLFLKRCSFLAAVLATFLTADAVPAAEESDQTVTIEQGCSFRSDPSAFLSAQGRVQGDLYSNVRKFSNRTSAVVSVDSLPRRNFIDDEIFGKLEQMKVQAAPLATDEEFVRRIYLDLTGRIPSPAKVRGFVADEASNKRDVLVDELLRTPEFTDRWSVWFADLVQNTERLSTSNRAPQVEGRNGLDVFLRDRIANNKSIRDIVTELITARGNNYLVENGQANYAVLASTAMGPAQDTYDMMLSRTASQFLGIASYDCLLCHNGRGHLTGISLWGERATRGEAQRMAAHFSRLRLNNGGTAAGAKQYEHPLYNSTDVQDAATGTYDLNTTSGNRPNRTPLGTERNLSPEYRDGSKPGAGQNWRAFYAEKLTNDPMFARNFANRLWKHFFGLGLVDPVDSLDPARLDPKTPPPAPWTLQATHPELLEKLAQSFTDSGGSLRDMARLLVTSTAYQLSSRYSGEWKLDYVPLFARHYPRRLDAEEIHDAIVAATGLLPRYTWPLVNGQTVPQNSALKQGDAVNWAMQLPDINEPRNNGTVRDWLRTFYRGNRDTAQRLQSGSILQQLNLMNSTFVLDRIRTTGANASPVLADIVKIGDPNQAVDELFVTFLSRKPTATEHARALKHLTQALSRAEAVADLAWACINKTDFLFSY